jgi:hypothetical protein
MDEMFQRETPVYVDIEPKKVKSGMPMSRVFLVVGRHRPYYLGEYDQLYAQRLKAKIEEVSPIFREKLKGLAWDSDEFEAVVHRLTSECEKACG